MGNTAPFMVIDTLIWSSGIPENNSHVVDRIDCDARHSDVTRHARVIAVIAAVGCKVEGDARALLSSRKIASVEGV